MTNEELRKIGIYQWKDIQPRYDLPDLLLGNGFSINLSPKFNYKSLFDTFLNKCNEPFKSLFNHFGTTNFEQILNFLSHALKVNTILKLETDLVVQSIEALKLGLIETIKEVHPRVDEVDWSKIDIITKELKLFGNIYSTNYDLYLYHIIMKTLDASRDDGSYIPYQDYFWGKSDNGFKEFRNSQCYRYKHVYYLHGALFIFNHGIRDLKILRDNQYTELIDIIANEIQKGHFPLFITEGTGIDKMKSIYTSNYLYFCLTKLNTSDKPIMIFGNSLSEYDSHIVSALQNKQRDMIISIYPGVKTQDQLFAELYNLKIKFPNYNFNIEFVDSTSIFPI